jgi:hypothetical protein
MYVLFIVVCPFVLFLLVIVLSVLPNERKVPIMSIKLKNEAAKNIFVSKKSLKILKVQSESLK